MRILQVISTFYPALAFGGPAKVAYDISKELAKRGHEIEAFTTNAYDQTHNFKPKFKEQLMNGFNVTYFNNLLRPGNLFLSPEMIISIRKKLKEFDVIHTHFGRQVHDIAVDYYSQRYGVPLVLQAHGSLPRIMAKKRLKWIYDVLFGYKLLKDASKVIALSQMEAQQYRNMAVPEEKITIIPNGIDLSEYAYLPPKGVFKNKFGIPEDKKLILYLGRIHGMKGIDLLVKAYAHLTRNMKRNDTVLVIAGPDDGYLREIRVLIKALEVEDSTLITDPLYGRDKLEAYIDAEVHVLPSRYEIWGMTVLEAYACGKPVVASRIGGLKDLVIDGVTGLLFDSGNVKQLASSIFYILNNGNEADEMGSRGKRFVEENFAIEKVVDRFEKLYESISQLSR